MNGSRPKIDLPFTTTDRILEAAALVGMAWLFWTPVAAWSELPEKVPVHFGFTGAPNGWAERGSIWLLPIVGLGLYALMAFLCRVPHIYNYPVRVTAENAGRLYLLGRRLLAWLKAGIMLVFAYIEWGMAEVAMKRSDGLAGTLFGLFLGFFGLVTAWHLWAMIRAK